MALVIEIIEIVIVVAAILVSVGVAISVANAVNNEFQDPMARNGWAVAGIIMFNILIMGILAVLLVWGVPTAIYNIR